MYQGHEISDSELKKYQSSKKALNNNRRAHLLYQHQRQHFSWLRENLKKTKDQKTAELNIKGVNIRLMLNKTRRSSIKADTFQNKNHDSKCVLCNLPPDQRGFPILEQQYFVIPNPGITIPRDLTIPATQHRIQEISGNFKDMLDLAKELYDYSIYYNGPLAGASCPHLHFQAGVEKQLPGERQLLSATENETSSIQLTQLNNIRNTKLYRVSNFLRACYLIVGRQKESISKIFDPFLAKFKIINQSFQSSQNVQIFGEYISALDKIEEEPRINLMANWNRDKNKYAIAIFPKRSNRPKIFYDQKNQIMLGMGIKESLGNLITFREKDFTRLQNNHREIVKAFRDTSITKSQSTELDKYVQNINLV